MSRFDFNTIEKKIEAIRNMKFSRNFRDLEVGLRFFDHYRFFVNHYAAIIKPLVRLKIQNFIDASVKERKKRNYFEKITLKQRHENTTDSFDDDRTNIDLSTNFACVKT